MPIRSPLHHCCVMMASKSSQPLNLLQHCWIGDRAENPAGCREGTWWRLRAWETVRCVWPFLPTPHRPRRQRSWAPFCRRCCKVPSHSSWLLSEIPPRASPWFIPWQASATSHCQGQEDKKYFCKRRITILFIPGRNLLASPGPPQPDWLRRAAGGRVPAGQSRSVGAPHCRLCPCGAPATAPTAAPPSGRAASGPSRAAGKKRGSPAVSARAAMLPWERRRAPPAANRQGPRGRRSRSVASPRPRCGHEAVGSARLRAARVCGSKPRSA